MKNLGRANKFCDSSLFMNWQSIFGHLKGLENWFHEFLRQVEGTAGMRSDEDQVFIEWDVGGWNCEKNPNSRDALVVLDASGTRIGQPWRGNPRSSRQARHTWTDARLVLPRFSSGLFRAMFAMKEIWNGKKIHRRVPA
jgi:hypothetical protein